MMSRHIQIVFFMTLGVGLFQASGASLISPAAAHDPRPVLIDIYQDDLLSQAGSPNSVALSSPLITLQNANNPSTASIQYRIDSSYKISFYARGSTNGRVYNNGAFVKITIIVCGGE